MQVKIFTIPIVGGDKLIDEMNGFLRGKKVLQLEHHVIKLKREAFWSFYVKYMEETVGGMSASQGFQKDKIDYQEVLDKASFARFTKLREVRKELAKTENIPAYHILTDMQMAEIAKHETLSIEKMKTVKGVGDKTIEKYGKHFLAIQL